MSHIVHTFIRKIKICLPCKKPTLAFISFQLKYINHTQPYFRNVIYTLALNILNLFFPPNECASLNSERRVAKL